MITIGDLELDAILSVDANHRVEPTMHPVDKGADITDHAVERPVVLSVKGVVSDAGIGDVAERRTVGVKPTEYAYAYLTGLIRSHELVRIESDVYPPFNNMMLISLSAPKDRATGEGYIFDASFQQVILATVNIDKEVTTIELPRAKRKVKKGAQETGAGGGSEEKESSFTDKIDNSESLAANGADSLGLGEYIPLFADPN